MDKDKLIIEKSGGDIVDVSHHIVSGEWYRMHVDYSYRGDTPVEIVELEYAPELYAPPAHMLESVYKRMSVSDILREVEV